MKIREEIERHAEEKDKPVLLALLDKYHWQSQWGFVAKCQLERYGKSSFQCNRVWVPTEEGICLYNHLLNVNQSDRG